MLSCLFCLWARRPCRNWVLPFPGKYSAAWKRVHPLPCRNFGHIPGNGMSLKRLSDQLNPMHPGKGGLEGSTASSQQLHGFKENWA